jgi:hypothetical protein
LPCLLLFFVSRRASSVFVVATQTNMNVSVTVTSGVSSHPPPSVHMLTPVWCPPVGADTSVKPVRDGAPMCAANDEDGILVPIVDVAG